MSFWTLFCDCKPKDVPVTLCLNNPEPTKAREDCPHTEIRKYREDVAEKMPVCGLDHRPIIGRWVCLDNDPVKVARPDCKRTEHRLYRKGDEPTEICELSHKPPPQPKLDPALNYFTTRRQFSAFFP